MHFAHYVDALLARKGAHPHNLYLQWLAELGIVPAGLLLGVWMRAVWGMGQTVRQVAMQGHAQEMMVGIVLWATILGMAVDAAFSGNLVMPVSQVWCAVAAGCGWRWVTVQALPGEFTAVDPGRWRVGGLVVLTIGLWCVSMVEFVDLQARLVELMNQMPTPKLSPRFWSHGWF